MTRPGNIARRLWANERGVTVIEFALVSPVFLLALMGSFDLGYTMYMKAVLNGAVQQAGRMSSLETGPDALDAIDDATIAMVSIVAINSEVSTTRRSYYAFSELNRGETLTADANGNGECDAGDKFEDENDNDVWDAQLGEDGIGGPKDVVLYTINVDYTPLFPAYRFLNTSGLKRISANTVLQNQPYGDQSDQPVVTELTCS